MFRFVSSISSSRPSLTSCSFFIGSRRTVLIILLPGGSFWPLVSFKVYFLSTLTYTNQHFCFSGVMYYYYSVWQMFYVFNRQLGPLVRICMIMFQHDLPKWIVMMMPFFVRFQLALFFGYYI